MLSVSLLHNSVVKMNSLKIMRKSCVHMCICTYEAEASPAYTARLTH